MKAALASARKWLLPLFVAGGLVYVAVLARPIVGRGFRVVASANAVALVIAAFLEAGSYLTLSAVLRRVAGPRRLSFGDAVTAGLLSFGIGRLLPASPAEGMALTSRQFASSGVSKRRLFVAIGLAQWYFARALFATAAVACLTVASIAFVDHAYLASGQGFLLVATVLFLVVFAVMGWLIARAHVFLHLGRVVSRVPLLRTRAGAIRSSLHAWVSEVHASAGNRWTRLQLLGLACVASALDAGCFYVALRAVGVHAGTIVIIAAYGIGMVGALMPISPGGIGVMEVAVPTFLVRAHVAFIAALGGVLAYRVIAWFAPAIIGFGILGHFHARVLVTKRHHGN